MTKKNIFKIAFLGFFFGYVFMSIGIYQVRAVLDYKHQTRGSFLQSLNPFSAQVNPFIVYPENSF